MRALLGCKGRVWPVSVERSTVCAEYHDGSSTRGEVEVDAAQVQGQWIERIWLDPPAKIHPQTALAIREFDAAIVGPGSFYTSLMPIFTVRGVIEALATVSGPVILVTNLLTEVRGMQGFTAGDAARQISAAIGRPIDVIVANTAAPSEEARRRYAVEHKEPLPIGEIPAGCELVAGDFWSEDIARHDRRRLAYAVWSVISRRVASSSAPCRSRCELSTE